MHCYTDKDMMRYTIHIAIYFYAAQNVPYGNIGMELKLAVDFNTTKVKSIISNYLEFHQTITHHQSSIHQLFKKVVSDYTTKCKDC